MYFESIVGIKCRTGPTGPSCWWFLPERGCKFSSEKAGVGVEEHQLLYLKISPSRLSLTISAKSMSLNSGFSFLPWYTLYNFNAAALAPAMLGACPSVRVWVLEDIAAMSYGTSIVCVCMMLYPPSAMVLALIAPRRMSTTRRPWNIISYVSWFSYLLSYERK